MLGLCRPRVPRGDPAAAARERAAVTHRAGANDLVSGWPPVVSRRRLPVEPVRVLIAVHEAPSSGLDGVVVAEPEHHRSGEARTPPVDEVVAGAKLRRVGDGTRDGKGPGERTVALTRCRLPNREPDGFQQGDRQREHRLDHDLPGSHPRAWLRKIEPEAVKVLAPLEDEQQLDQSVDLPARRVAEVADPDETGGACGVAGVLEAGHRVADQPDAAAPLSVEQLRPGQLLWLLVDNSRVVAERIEIEGGGDARAEARFRSDGEACPLVCPFDYQAIELARSRGGALPATGAVRVQVEPAEGGVALPVGAASVTRSHLAELEQPVDLVPSRDPSDLDRLQVSRCPVRIDEDAAAGEDVEGRRLLAYPAIQLVLRGDLGQDLDADIPPGARREAGNLGEVVTDGRNSKLAVGWDGRRARGREPERPCTNRSLDEEIAPRDAGHNPASSLFPPGKGRGLSGCAAARARRRCEAGRRGRRPRARA